MGNIDNPLYFISRNWYRFANFFELKLLAFSERIQWSFLATFGQSPITKLTILVPFVGYLIIFNQHVQTLFELSLDKLDATLTIDSAGERHELRMYNLFFGLLFVGIASFFYTLFAPRQIKNHPLVADYVRYMDSIKTENLTRSSLDNLFGRLLDRRVEDGMMPSLSFPSEVSGLTHQFVKSFYQSSDYAKDPPGEDEGVPPENVEAVDELYTGSGYLLTDNIATRMYMNRRYDWAFADSMFRSALKNERDVFVLEHMALDYSNFAGRSFVFLLYAAGFIVLFIPTARITWQIANLLIFG